MAKSKQQIINELKDENAKFKQRIIKLEALIENIQAAKEHYMSKIGYLTNLLKDKYTISSEDAEFLRKAFTESIDLNVKIDRLTAENGELTEALKILGDALKIARDEIGYEGNWESVVQDKIEKALKGETNEQRAD
mgnify:CR=1 FL=1